LKVIPDPIDLNLIVMSNPKELGLIVVSEEPWV